MQRSSWLLCRRTMRSSTQNFLLTIPISSMSTSLKRQLKLLLQPGAQRQRPAQGIRARRLYQPAPNRHPVWVALPWRFSLSTSRERVVDLVLFRGDGRGLWLTLHGASDSFFCGAIVEVLNLLVVFGFPVDEHADGDEEIIGLIRRDDAFSDGIGHSLRYGMLGRPEHLHCLACILDCHFVVQNRRGLTHKVWRHQRE